MKRISLMQLVALSRNGNKWKTNVRSCFLYLYQRIDRERIMRPLSVHTAV
jgi:hypothetical protein